MMIDVRESAPKEKRRILTDAVAILLAAVIGAGVTLWVAERNYPEQLDNDVEDVLEFDLLNQRATNHISDTTAGVEISGRMLQSQLPPGKQIYAAARAKNNDADRGDISTSTLSFLPPCSVDINNRSFNCGYIDLGSRIEPGTYFIYVGLADSAAAKELVYALIDQSKGGEAENWDNAAPAGYKTLPPLTVER